MDWSGRGQVLLLFQSTVPGIMIGALFDANSGFFRCCILRRYWGCIDALWGCTAALITFFSALILADGQLHPVLLAGVLFGFIAEHYTIGRLVRFCVHGICVGIQKCGRLVWRFCWKIWTDAIKRLKSRKKQEKTRCFFKKALAISSNKK